MTASSLPAALRAGADGLYALEAATGLIMARASWLAREDFARYIDAGIGITDPRTEMASIDWEATISALDAGELPSSAASGECSASRPASPTRPPVSLGDAITGIDHHNVGLLVKAAAPPPPSRSCAAPAGHPGQRSTMQSRPKSATMSSRPPSAST
jgi:hypothetical protein